MSHPDFSGGGTTDAIASAVDLAPTLLAFAGFEEAQVKERFPGLRGHSLLPAMSGEPVRKAALTAVEILTTLDADYWREFGESDGPERMQSGALRPDWSKRGFLRGYTDNRYTFARYFSPLEPNRPRTVRDLFAANDVVMYDRATDPDEVVNLAYDPAHLDTVTDLLARLEQLIDDEIGQDTHAWVTERPRLGAYPSWHGDHPAAARVPATEA
jgi:arylsulfatase